MQTIIGRAISHRVISIFYYFLSLSIHNFLCGKEVGLNASLASITVAFVQQARIFSPTYKCVITIPITVILPTPFTKRSQLRHQLWTAICECQRGVVAVKVCQSYKCTAGYNEPQICIKPLAPFHQRTPAPAAPTCPEWSDIQEKPHFITICFWRKLFKSG